LKPLFATLVTTVLLLAFATEARAGLTGKELAGLSLSPPPNAAAPLALGFRDVSGAEITLGGALGGRPAILLLVDYTCRTICGPALAIASGALSQSGLDPAKDFRLVVVGFDAKDSAEDARAMSRQIADAAVESATTLLRGDARNTRRLTEALGYHYEYDDAADQFAHPAGALVLASDGRISRVLSSLALNPQDLRLALVEAGEGRVGTLGDRLTLLCYGFDAMHGVYTPAITWLLQLFAALTVIGLLGSILLLKRNRGAVGGAG
jgi:protein SCO1/2